MSKQRLKHLINAAISIVLLSTILVSCDLFKDDDDDLCMAITPSSDLTLRNNSV